MAMLAKLLMDEFDARSKKFYAEGDDDRGFVFGHAEGMVNNFLHGRPFEETARLTRTALDENSRSSYSSEEEKVAYAETVKVLDEFVAAHSA